MPLLALALFDIVPVVIFLVGGGYLASAARFRCGERSQYVAILGVLMIFLGGAAKACAKFGTAVGYGGIAPLGEIHFVLQAPGFVLLLLSALFMARKDGAGLMAARPMAAVAVWKMPLMIVTALAGTGMNAVLAGMSWRRKSRVAAGGFVLSLICLLAMGGLSSGDQSVVLQWLEESINSIGQFGFLAGSFLLQQELKTEPTNAELLLERGELAERGRV